MNENKKATKSDKLLNLVLVVVIAAVLAVGVYATYGTIAVKVEDKAVLEGREEATVSYLARQADLDVEDYLAQYGLELNDVITARTTESEMLDNMTLENYLKYQGGTQTAEEVLEGTQLTDKATKDTLWKDVLPMIPAVSILGEESFNQVKEQYNIDNDSISWGELQELLSSQDNGEQTAASEDAQEAPQAE